MEKKEISRRSFMQRTAGAASATLAARSFLLEPGLLEAAPRPVPPSDTVRLGIIGVGMQGSGLLRTSIRLPGVECVAACDLYDGRQELAKEIVDKPIPTTRRYQELLDNKEIDCLIAAVPDHWHKQIVVDACNAGNTGGLKQGQQPDASQPFVELTTAGTLFVTSCTLLGEQPKNCSPQLVRGAYSEGKV